MNSSRTKLTSIFLSQSSWKNAKRTSIQGDASRRQYERLTCSMKGTSILMDAPPEHGEDVKPFVKVCKYFQKIGLSVPKIYESDISNGFLILEDFGENLFSKMLINKPNNELEFYINATDNLIRLYHSTPLKGLDVYNCSDMVNKSLLALDWYLEYGLTEPPNVTLKTEFYKLLNASLINIMSTPHIMVHRDFHAENLIWLNHRKGYQRVGILDFQDTMLGHPAYDLASLLNDIRREVNPEIKRKCLEHYLLNTKLNVEDFEHGFSVCSAQRNLRILGVFTRLSVRDNKKGYLTFIPRIWRKLIEDLQHPALGDLNSLIRDFFPEPNNDVIQRIKNSHVS